MDIYAINNWDAVIYAYGANLINLMFGSTYWKLLVVVMSIFAFARNFFEIKNSPSIAGEFVKRAAAVFLFSFLTLWPVKVTLSIYTITKAEAYTNVFKWIVPVGRGDKFTADLYLSTDINKKMVRSC